MSAKREWGPTGVVPPGHTSFFRLPDDRWEQIQLIVKERIGRLPPDAFRTSLNNALQVGLGMKYLHERSTPKQIRANLKVAYKAAEDLAKALEKLDGNSKNLLDEVELGSFRDLFAAAIRAENLLIKAQAKAGELPTTKAGIKDYGPRNFGYYLVWAIRWHLAPDYVSGDSRSLYVQLYQELAEYVGYSATIQAARVALKFACERDAEDPTGPPRV